MIGNQNQVNYNANLNNQAGLNMMNQFLMNASGNNLYLQNTKPTWQNMQPMNNFVNQNNLNNSSNILSLINLPILVPYHCQHPLISCLTPGRAEISPNWICNGCGCHYSYSVPTFYCTACDFDLCQRCLLSLSSFMISIYNYNMSFINESTQFTNYSHYHADKHKHPIVKIIRDKTYAEIRLRCNLCTKVLQKDEQFYYCSLCNYCICLNCYGMNGMNNIIVDNPEYLSNNQMNMNSNNK
jgi:hypothetical protein